MSKCWLRQTNRVLKNVLFSFWFQISRSSWIMSAALKLIFLLKCLLIYTIQRSIFEMFVKKIIQKISLNFFLLQITHQRIYFPKKISKNTLFHTHTHLTKIQSHFANTSIDPRICIFFLQFNAPENIRLTHFDLLGIKRDQSVITAYT